ncbi:MAG: hypothetical protein LBH44_01895 [Treponema sp.]|jgi:hypothetical protein|nr:hypothetical protein [Treponema sp.]
MERKTTVSLIDKWKKSFSDNTAKDAGNETVQNEEASIVLIKKEPVTFQLSLLESPEDFERMRFVIKACDKASDSIYKTVLHVEQTRTGSRLVATDGLRLHVAEISIKIKSGDYKPYAVKDTISLGKPLENVQFPSWPKAIPKKTEKRGVINLKNSGLGKNRKETEKLSLAFNDFVRKTGEPVNLRYLEDLIKSEWAVFCQNEKRKAIILKEKTGKADSTNVPLAVIMPIAQAA